MKLLLSLALALPLAAQVPCKLALGSSITMRALYGGKTDVIQGRVSCANNSMTPVIISGVNLDLSLPTLDTVPATDADAMLTKTYNNQTGQVLSRDITTGLGAFGILQAAKVISISTGPAGWIVAGAISVIQYILPSLTASEPPTPTFSNQCDSITGVTLGAGQSLTCTIYVKKPGKKDPQIPAAFGFTLGSGSLTPIISPPLELRAPHTGAEFKVNPETPAITVIGETLTEKIMLAHEAGYLAANQPTALPEDPCAWASCTTWEDRALAR